MKIFLSSFFTILFLSLSFSGALFFENNKNYNSFFVNNASAVENEENLASENIKPWEAYRGWAPSVPYGKNYSSKRKPKSKKSLRNDRKTFNQPKGNGNQDEKSQEDSTKNEDHIEPWEAYRGWAPSVPYGK